MEILQIGLANLVMTNAKLVLEKMRINVNLVIIKHFIPTSLMNALSTLLIVL